MDERIMADLARQLEPKLPDALQRIKQSLHEEYFHDMCAEYEDGMRCLRRLADRQRERIVEYTELIEDLEREILRYLQEH